MWTYFLGPILAIFPVPWRRLIPFGNRIQWDRATAISGFAEAVLATVALMYWYMHAMSLWVGNGVSLAADGKMGTEVRIQDVGGAALIVWWMHPLTWLFVFFGLEGAIRMCSGAFGNYACGIFPLFLTDKIFFGPFRMMNRSGESGNNVSAHVGAIRDRVQSVTLREVPDELSFTNNESGVILEIRSSRKKQDWNPPRVVRYDDRFYRLEADSNAGGTRPFLYQLRRLPAGVMGRTVLIYAPTDIVIRAAATR